MTNLQQPIEEWKDIPNYEGLYQVSTFGRIKSLDRTISKKGYTPYIIEGRILKFILSFDGRNRVMLYHPNLKRSTLSVSELVFFTFNPHIKKIKGYEIDHDDNIKTNNYLSNLKYITGRANSTKRSLNLFKTSQYTGVSLSKKEGVWQSHIRFKGKSYYLGKYKNELEAATAYQKALSDIESGVFKKREPLKQKTSQYLGVSFNRNHNRWVAFSKKKYLGLYASENEAHNAIQNFLKQVA